MTVINPPNLSGYVPYTGATGNVNLGVYTITAALLKGQYSNLAGSAYINPDGSAVFAGGSVVINTGGEVTAVSVRGQYLKSDNDLGLYDNIVGQYGSIDLDDAVYYFRDWDGSYNTLQAYRFVAHPSGTNSAFQGGSGDTGTYPLTGGYFYYSHANANYDSLNFTSLDPNDEWGGGAGLNINPEEGVSIYSQSSGFNANGGGVNLYTGGGSVFYADTSGATVYGTQGSASTPTYGFLSDNNTGMYLFAADTLAFATNGTPQMIIGNAAISISLSTGITGTLNVSTSVASPIFTSGITVGGTLRLRSTTGVGTTDTILFQVGNNGATEAGRIVTSGRWGFKGITVPTATIHLPAGSTAASSAPIKRTSGALMTTPEVGADEFLTDSYYLTITTGAARKEVTLNDIALTSGRVNFNTTNGRLTDSANFAYTSGTGLLLSDNLKLTTAGNGLYVKEGTNATMGIATLVAGTVVVNTNKVTANSRIFLTVQSLGTVAVATPIAITARVAGTSFTITSSGITDTSVVAWQITEPA